MNKIVIIILSLVLLVSACQPIVTNSITLKEVLTSFENQQVPLKEINISRKIIFGMKLNGVRPDSYEIDGKLLSIYIYNSSKEREKGLEDFNRKTESANVVSYRYYIMKNVLFFYVHEVNQGEEIPFDVEIQQAINELDQSIN